MLTKISNKIAYKLTLIIMKIYFNLLINNMY